MRLESALYSAREGLDAHGKAISVIGDNISNTNTVGYRVSRIEFADILADGMNGGLNVSDNPSMPSGGSGVSVQRVRQLQEGGVIEDTGRDLDLAVDGNGYFVVTDGTSNYLTKAGNFEIDTAGYLSTSTGYRVMGTTGTGTTVAPINMLNVNLSGSATTTCSLSGNLSSSSAVTTLPTNPQTFKDLASGVSFAFNVDAFDSLGARQNLAIYFYKTGVNQWTAQAYVDAGKTGGTAGTPQLVGQSTLNFNPDGSMATNPAGLTAQMTFTGASPSSIAVDLSKIQQFAADNNIDILSANGQGAGSIKSYQFQKNGKIIASLDSGAQVTVGSLQLGSVKNVDGLERAGESLYAVTDKSGALTTGNPQAAGLGATLGGALERSATDISTEFVNLTLFQRGYQANSQVLSAANNMIQQTLQLIR